MHPEDEAQRERQRDVNEEVQEEEGAGEGALTGEGSRDRLRENRQGIEEARPLDGESLPEGVPDHDVAGPAEDEHEADQDEAGEPGQRTRPPEPVLGHHPQGVDDGGHDGAGRGVAMQPPHPVADPGIGGQARHRPPRIPDPVEKQQPEPGADEHEEHGNDDGPALIERIVAPAVEPVGDRVGGTEEAAAGPFERIDDSRHQAS